MNPGEQAAAGAHTFRLGRASAQRVTWLALFLLISAGSMSRCTMRARAANASSLPVLARQDEQA